MAHRAEGTDPTDKPPSSGATRARLVEMLARALRLRWFRYASGAIVIVVLLLPFFAYLTARPPAGLGLIITSPASSVTIDLSGRGDGVAPISEPVRPFYYDPTGLGLTEYSVPGRSRHLHIERDGSKPPDKICVEWSLDSTATLDFEWAGGTQLHVTPVDLTPTGNKGYTTDNQLTRLSIVPTPNTADVNPPFYVLAAGDNAAFMDMFLTSATYRFRKEGTQNEIVCEAPRATDLGLVMGNGNDSFAFDTLHRVQVFEPDPIPPPSLPADTKPFRYGTKAWLLRRRTDKTHSESTDPKRTLIISAFVETPLIYSRGNKPAYTSPPDSVARTIVSLNGGASVRIPPKTAGSSLRLTARWHDECGGANGIRGAKNRTGFVAGHLDFGDIPFSRMDVLGCTGQIEVAGANNVRRQLQPTTRLQARGRFRLREAGTSILIEGTVQSVRCGAEELVCSRWAAIPVAVQAALIAFLSAVLATIALWRRRRPGEA